MITLKFDIPAQLRRLLMKAFVCVVGHKLTFLCFSFSLCQRLTNSVFFLCSVPLAQTSSSGMREGGCTLLQATSTITPRNYLVGPDVSVFFV